MEVTLRPVQASDEAFLISVFASTRDAELALVPWSLEQKAAFIAMQFRAQNADYAFRYPGAQHDIICADSVAVGRLFLARLDDQLRIADVAVLPEYQGKGIGAWVLRRIMDEAATLQKPVTVYVEINNPSLQWFERKGFERGESSGFNILMRWTPAV